jgi:hypothetical protein
MRLPVGISSFRVSPPLTGLYMSGGKAAEVWGNNAEATDSSSDSRPVSAIKHIIGAVGMLIRDTAPLES